MLDSTQIERIKQAIKWKKSNEYAAEKLGITVKEYIDLKKTVKELEEEAEVSTASQMLIDNNLNLNEFKVNSGWIKSEGISVQFNRKQEQLQSFTESISEIIKNHSFKYKPVETTNLNEVYTDNSCAVLSLQDIHVGKLNLDNKDDIVKTVQDCVASLIIRAYNSYKLDKIMFVLGGDLLNMDTYLGTTTSGTLVENSLTAYEAYKETFDLMFWCITYLKQFCNILEVIYIPGNHSRLSEAHIAYALSKCINDPNIIWDVEYAERKVKIYGNSMICFEHGDYAPQRSPITFAVEYPKEWGMSKYRVLYTGHYHKQKKVEYLTQDEVSGFTFRILPSLTRSDMYHYSNKWTGNHRGGIIEIHSEKYGNSGEFRYFE